jgi:hypothetical protein
MKTLIIVVAIASLALPVASASAQNRSGAATNGMGSADSTLRARGDVKGAERIERAECFSGLGVCNQKDAEKVKNADEHATPTAKSGEPD